MARKEALKGLIEEKQGELSAILDQQAENVRQYKVLWEERNVCLDSGHTLKAHELEGKYYHLRDVVGKKLDKKRIEIDNEIEELQAEAYRLKNKLKLDTGILDRQQQELQRLEKEYQDKLAEQQKAISDTEFTLKHSEQRILELEGSE
ncbi:hypothetical protein [Niallia sp. MER 6]|uniref:hypothetical protein n=1 Tax=Niallia sp. MER 6 TaxID=2939567 RepID=UPI00203EE745|nr:hypothetical protein [Niallia sp. MER 6]MCM3034087.1 hypothetical protein [Niallia sp. MER 6]